MQSKDHSIPKIGSMAEDKVAAEVAEYVRFHNDDKEDRTGERKGNYAAMVNAYYNLATDFYEWGWGQSFHFAVQAYTESFQTSIVRHEHYLALRLQLEKGWRVLDVGCGVGGPARNIAHFAKCNVTGLNNNQYQVDRATALSTRQGLRDSTNFVKGDFMKQPFEDNTFDAVYQIEATAHAPDKVGCYKEIFRVLKPGQLFGGYEWCLTDKYDPSNPQHRQIKKGIEEGDGLPDIATCNEVVEALKEAGFEIVEAFDAAHLHRPDFDYPWFYYLTPGYNRPSRFQFTPAGKYLTKKVLGLAEKLHIVPAGTNGVSGFLMTAAEALSAGGEQDLFTPMFFHLARKPLDN